MKPPEILARFDTFLVANKLSFSCIVIGGAALSVLGVITRETDDCDVIDPVIPDDIRAASEHFAHACRSEGIDLRRDWFNSEPRSLAETLPPEWRSRTQSLFVGRALHLDTLAREDLLRCKLFAYCDRLTDLHDCVALMPTSSEIETTKPWVKLQDANPQWPAYVDRQLAELERRIAECLTNDVMPPPPHRQKKR